MRPDGSFSFPLVGEVDAKGKTVADLNKAVSQKLAKYISDPVVTVSIQEIKGNKVYVIGQVNKPGEFIMNPTVDVMQALSMAGGTTPFAALGDIIVLRRTPTGKQSLPFRYNDVVRASGSTRTSICRAATWWWCREARNRKVTVNEVPHETLSCNDGGGRHRWPAPQAGAAAWELESQGRGGLPVRRQLPPDARPAREIEVQGPLVDAAARVAHAHADRANSVSRRACAPPISPTRPISTPSTISARSTGSTAASACERRVRGEFAQQDIVNSEQPDAEARRRPRRGGLRRLRASCCVDNRRTRCEPAAVDELRTVAAPRAAVRRRLHRRELRRRDSSARRSTTPRPTLPPACVHGSTNASTLTDAPARRALRHRHSQRDVTNAYGAELQWDTRTAAETRTYLRAGAQNVELSDGRFGRPRGSPAPA